MEQMEKTNWGTKDGLGLTNERREEDHKSHSDPSPVQEGERSIKVRGLRIYVD
jgi:hypothetical protein